jgi:hypothetical protein
MKFRIAVLGNAPTDPTVRAALMRQVTNDTGVEPAELEARLAEAEPWLVELDAPEESETLRARWEALHPIHLTAYPRRAAPTSAEATGPAATPGGDDAESAVPPTTPAAPPQSRLHRPPPILRPGKVLDMRIQAPPPRTSRLFLLLVIVGGLAAAKSWHEWYTERPVGGLQGVAGAHCAADFGWVSMGPEENQSRFERTDAAGACNADLRTNPLGCAPPRLVNDARTLSIGEPSGFDLTLALPAGDEGRLEPGTYEVKGVADDATMATSNQPRCKGWTGSVTIDSLTWRLRPRATSHARWEVVDLSVHWSLACLSGVPTRTEGCFGFGGGEVNPAP